MNELCRLLIVDDEYLVRQGIKHLMNWENEGFQVIGEAANGKEALELIEQVRPHIVLTDIVMPVMDGEAFTRTVKLRYPEIEVIVLSSFSEFEYVRSTFQSGVADYILKPTLDNKELLEILRATAARIPTLRMDRNTAAKSIPTITQVVDRLMSGYDADGYEDTIQAYFPHTSYYWLGCDLSQLNIHPSQESARMREDLIHKIQSYLSEKGLVHLHVNTDRAALLFLLNCDEQENHAEVLAEIVSGLSERQQQWSLNPVWILGEPCTEFQNLGQVYKDSFKKLMDKTFYFPDCTFLIASELTVSDRSSPEPFNMTHFSEQFKRKHYEEALQYLQKHIEEISTHHEKEVFEFKSFLVNVIFTMTNLLAQHHVDAKSLDEEKYGVFKKIDDAKYARDAVQQVNDYITKLRAVIETEVRQDNPIQPLLEYMHDHYMEQLTLADLAKHFHFNPSYLSSYFSVHTQEGFSDYLNKIRMEKAIELLKDPSVMISDISGRVGYSEHSYFCKVFKKYNGQSPSSYRKKIGKSG